MCPSDNFWWSYEVVEHDRGGEDGDEADGDAEDVNAAEPVANVCRASKKIVLLFQALVGCKTFALVWLSYQPR